MSLAAVEIVFAACALATLISAIWLLLHLPELAALFARSRAIAPAGRPQVSRTTTMLVLVAFNLGWIACVAIWIWVIGGDANQVVDASA